MIYLRILVTNDLLDLPILYLSRYINHNKAEYYSLIQAIRNNSPDNQKDWENWILFILKGIEQTSKETVILVQEIKKLMDDYKQKLRTLFGAKYNHELLNNLFNIICLLRRVICKVSDFVSNYGKSPAAFTCSGRLN